MKTLTIPKSLSLKIQQLAQKELVFCCQKFPKALSVDDRKQFRKLLIQSIKKQPYYKENLKLMDLKPLLKLGFKPQQTLMAISISHCKDLALFVFTFKKSQNENLSIGIDIEETKRVSEALALRVSTKQECLNSPKPSLLWTAKEASFKCFSGNKKLLLSECQISGWKKIQESYYFSSSYKKQKAKGMAFLWGPMSLAYAQTV